MIVMIDNYDSFTYNLVQYFGDLNTVCEVYRNDKISVTGVLKKNPKAIVISPGPGTPDDSGITLDLIKSAYDHDIPVLGVCLGHQAIGQAFGGRVVQTPPQHGKTSIIKHNNISVFKGIEGDIKVTRYHSLCVEAASLPEELVTTAVSEDGVIMGLMHKTAPLHGVQFHPESIATDHGHTLLQTFLEIV